MKNESDRKEARLNDAVGQVRKISLDCIIPNRFQPRQAFDPAALQELMDSIRTSGVLEPILVRLIPKTRAYQKDCPPNAEYEIIMGERRFRACQGLKLATIPAIVMEPDDRQMLEWALIENTHRADLNPIERAKAYKQLADTFHLTHQQVAERVGADRAVVTNFIRLLTLPAEIQDDIARQTIKVGHALILLAVPDSARRLMLWQRVKNEDLSIRHLKVLVDAYMHPRGVSVGTGRATQYKELHPGNDPTLKELYEQLIKKFGPHTQININCGKMGEQFIFGNISIGCRTEDELRRIINLMA